MVVAGVLCGPHAFTLHSGHIRLIVSLLNELSTSHKPPNGPNGVHLAEGCIAVAQVLGLKARDKQRERSSPPAPSMAPSKPEADSSPSKPSRPRP